MGQRGEHRFSTAARSLAVSSPENASAGEVFLRWLFPLHTGHAFGLPGRIAILVLGLMPTVLYITGFIRWRQKRRRGRQRKREMEIVTVPRQGESYDLG